MAVRLAMTTLGLAVLVYLGLCGLMFARQRELMYYPQLTRVDAAQTDHVLLRDGITLRGWRVNPARRDAILYFGGNAERIESNREAFARWFPDSSAYLMPYRGYGANPGAPDEQTLQADALALFDQVWSLHPDGRIAVIGRSLGSGVASFVAGQRDVARLVLVTPFDSLARTAQAHYRWLPVRWLLRDRYDSIASLARYAGPVLIVRAGRDRVIPPANTDRLVAALPRAEVLDLPQAGHDSVDDFPPYGETIARFLAREGDVSTSRSGTPQRPR
jgi:uncharacterized protein